MPLPRNRVREYRKQHGMTLSQLARAAGVSQQFLSLVESRRRMPSYPTLVRLAGALETTPGRLFPFLLATPPSASDVAPPGREKPGREPDAPTAATHAAGCQRPSDPDVDSAAPTPWAPRKGDRDAPGLAAPPHLLLPRQRPHGARGA